MIVMGEFRFFPLMLTYLLIFRPSLKSFCKQVLFDFSSAHQEPWRIQSYVATNLSSNARLLLLLPFWLICMLSNREA